MQIPKIIHISIRRWFDRTHGNSYFSAQIIVDGVLAHVIPFQYGRGAHPLFEAGQLVFGTRGYLDSLCSAAGVELTEDDATVTKREAEAHGEVKL